MITCAIINHYKSIERAHLFFRNTNIIVGPNGVGKSNIIDAISFIHDCIVEDIDTAITKRHGIESIRQWSKTRPFHINIELQFDSEQGYGMFRLVLASTRGGYKIIEERGEWTGSSIFSNQREEAPITGTFVREEDGIVRITSTDSRIKSPSDPTVAQGDLFASTLNGPITIFTILFSGLAEQLKSIVTYSIYPNTLRQPQVVSRENALLSDGSNLASILKKMNISHRRNKDNLVEALRVVMPSLLDINVKSAGGYYVPVMRVKEPNGEGHEFNMSQVSDGTLRVLGLLTAFYQPSAPRTIALEEPEQMIHPGMLAVIADAEKDFVSSRAAIKGQTFLTTHSPTLLDLFDPQDIIWANLKDGLTICGQVNERQISIIKEQLFTAGELLIAEGFYE